MWGQENSEVHYYSREQIEGPAGELVQKTNFLKQKCSGIETMTHYAYEYLDLNDIMNFRNVMEELWYEDMNGNIILDANLTEKDSIDFGKAQIGETIY